MTTSTRLRINAGLAHQRSSRARARSTPFAHAHAYAHERGGLLRPEHADCGRDREHDRRDEQPRAAIQARAFDTGKRRDERGACDRCRRDRDEHALRYELRDALGRETGRHDHEHQCRDETAGPRRHAEPHPAISSTNPAKTTDTTFTYAEAVLRSEWSDLGYVTD